MIPGEWLALAAIALAVGFFIGAVGAASVSVLRRGAALLCLLTGLLMLARAV